jgi:hypothetical protein
VGNGDVLPVLATVKDDAEIEAMMAGLAREELAADEVIE